VNKKIVKESLQEACWNALAATVMTLLLYQFFSIEFFRANLEDRAFDLTSWFALSQEKTDIQAPNLFLLLVDDKYLKKESLLDEYNETTYGYIMPRSYLADIIQRVDTLVEDLDTQNYPKALFLDYDIAYLSDPNNKTPTYDDKLFLEQLKKDRPYIIYLPMTSNYNIVYRSQDTKIQQLIASGKLRFVSVGLTIANDDLSRRYLSYEVYRDKNNTKRKFYNIAVTLWHDYNTTNNSLDGFSLDDNTLIENRIIFKNKEKIEQMPLYDVWQSYWKPFQIFSASYPLDMIYEDDLQNAVIMIGAGHSESDDTFEIDDYNREITGVEMHANALMTLFFLDGKLQRLYLPYTIILIFFIIFIVYFSIELLYNSFFFCKIKEIVNSFQSQTLKNFLLWIQPDKSVVSLFVSMGFLFGCSYILLKEYHCWFNWMVPVMMSIPYMGFIYIKKMILK